MGHSDYSLPQHRYLRLLRFGHSDYVIPQHMYKHMRIKTCTKRVFVIESEETFIQKKVYKNVFIFFSELVLTQKTFSFKNKIKIKINNNNLTTYLT